MDLSHDLNDVRAFVKVVETASFTDAGRALGLSRSSVSRRINELEDALGVRLLHRTTRHVGVTESGQAFYSRCADALAAIDMAREAILAAQEEPAGHLRLTAPHDLGELISPLITSFIERYPRVTMTIELSQRMVDLVAEGFDVALRAGSLPHASLIARKLWGGRGGLYASCAYLAAHGTPTAPSDLVDHRLIALAADRAAGAAPITWALENERGQTETIRIKPAVRTNDPSIARRLARDGAGITFLPESTANHTSLATATPPNATPLTRVLPQWHFARKGGVYLVYPTSKHLSATVRAFRDHVLAMELTPFSS